MSSIIITPTDQKELDLLLTIFKKMRITNKVVESDKIEDILLGIAMTEANRNEKISESTIMEQLNSKL